MVLAFGMAVVGCNRNGATRNDLEGTWENANRTVRVTFLHDGSGLWNGGDMSWDLTRNGTQLERRTWSRTLDRQMTFTYRISLTENGRILTVRGSGPELVLRRVGGQW